MNRIHWSLPLMAVLLAIIAALALQLKRERASAPQVDGRSAIWLNASERHAVLTEMRQFLSGIQTMSEALGREDLDTVARTAKQLGIGATRNMPPGLMEKLPPEFRQLGMSVHRDFDQIALDAQSLGDPRHSLQQLGRTLAKCVACHGAYQLRVGSGPD